ncbi:MAG: hypothetical protein ABIR29_00695 [Chthoniobacterales bacterium]
MKKAILSILLTAATSVAFGQELTTTTATTTTTTRPGRVETVLPKPRPPSAAPLIPTEVAVQVALRTGQPIQLINPAAPAEYGNSQERVSHDPNNPGKPKGIVLFAWSF